MAKHPPNDLGSDDSHDVDLGLPIDPTTNPQSFMGDTYGLSGITVQQNGQKNVDPLELEKANSVFTSPQISTVTLKQNKMKKIDTEVDNLLLEQMDDSANETIHAATPPSVLGEQAVSGDMPDPESDDDTLLNSHQVGLRLDEDEENPQPLDIAADVMAAEKSRFGSADIHDDSDL